MSHYFTLNPSGMWYMSGRSDEKKDRGLLYSCMKLVSDA